MNKKISRIIGAAMALFAIGFVAFAVTHPEISFPWSNTVTYALYGLYTVMTAILLIAPSKRM